MGFISRSLVDHQTFAYTSLFFPLLSVNFYHDVTISIDFTFFSVTSAGHSLSIHLPLSLFCKMYKTLAICASFAAAVSAHGNITFPAARQAGPAMAAVCGQAAVDAVNSDPTIPVEDLGTIDAGCSLKTSYFSLAFCAV